MSDQDVIVEREGRWCNIDGCTGTMEWRRDLDRSCICHISAPCGACLDMKLTCTKCGHVLEVVEDIEDDRNIITRYMEMKDV